LSSSNIAGSDERADHEAAGDADFTGRQGARLIRAGRINSRMYLLQYVTIAVPGDCPENDRTFDA